MSNPNQCIPGTTEGPRQPFRLSNSHRKSLLGGNWPANAAGMYRDATTPPPTFQVESRNGQKELSSSEALKLAYCVSGPRLLVYPAQSEGSPSPTVVDAHATTLSFDVASRHRGRQHNSARRAIRSLTCDRPILLPVPSCVYGLIWLDSDEVLASNSYQQRSHRPR